MFVISPGPLRERSSSPGRDRKGTGESLALLAERIRPVSSSRTRLLPVVPPLTGLFPDRGLRRGTTIVVTGRTPIPTSGPESGGGAVSVALSLLAAASASGSWCALVGLTGVGGVAAHDVGIDLSRLALIPQPQAAWAEVTAALVDGVDLVVLCPPFPPRPAMARRLAARVRDRRAVLVVIPLRSGWPDHPDVTLHVDDMDWDGIGTGEGYLSRRRMRIVATGRRSSGRPRQRHLWLPSTTGAVADADADGPVAAP